MVPPRARPGRGFAVIHGQADAMRQSLCFALLSAVLTIIPSSASAQSVSAAQAARPPAAPAPTPTPALFQSSRILVETKGQGPDVVLIPGLASTSAVWARTAAALEGRYRVHLVTVRGFGETAPGGNAEGLVSAPVA